MDISALVAEIVERFEFDTHSVIALVGAGGKTTMMKEMGRVLAEKFGAALLTTSTHVALEEMAEFRILSVEEAISKEYFPEGLVVVSSGEETKGGIVKLKAISQEELWNLKKLNIPILVEADGSARHPVKIFSDRDPVLYEGMDFVISILGTRSCGKRIEEVAFRPESVASFLQKGPKDLVTIEDLNRIQSAMVEKVSKLNPLWKLIPIMNDYLEQKY